MTFVDITGREAGAKRPGDRLAAIVTSSNDAIISTDLDGIVTELEQGRRRLFGYTADEIVGKSVALLIPPDHDDEEPEILARIGRRERSITTRPCGCARMEATSTSLLTVSPMCDAGGKVMGASKVAHDISER